MARVHNLTGMRFGRLTVLEMDPERYVSPSGRTNTRWRCRCDCGCETVVIGTHLTAHRITSCGCYGFNKRIKREIIDLTGRKFGRLTVLEKMQEDFVYLSGYRTEQWRCKCECGNEYITKASLLLGGNVKSCGCAWRCHIK